MKVVIADTSPLNYLLLIGHVDVLQALYQQIVIPSEVRTELLQMGAPPVVKAWARQPPEWLLVRSAPLAITSQLSYLDAGERAAIYLAQILHADLFIVDDAEARAEAERRGLQSIGVLGVLGQAHRRGLLDFSLAFSKLKRTSFRYSSRLIADLLIDLGIQ